MAQVGLVYEPSIVIRHVCTALFYLLSLSSANYFHLDHGCKSEHNEDMKAAKKVELQHFRSFLPKPIHAIGCLTTVMKVKASLYIMREMNTCGTEIYHPYKQSVIGHNYRAELYFMQFSNQNICVCVNIHMWEFGKQNRLEHKWAIRRRLRRRKGSRSHWGLLPSRGAFVAGVI